MEPTISSIITVAESGNRDASDALFTALYSELHRMARGQLARNAVDPMLVQVVDLKFFCSFSFAEIGAMWGQSERTVQRHWEKARIYLHGAIGNSV